MEGRENDEDENEDCIEPERYDLALLAIGKRAGLSFGEINEFGLNDLFAYVREYTGEREEKPRMATQKDIDKFFAN